jgi:outer membrane lipoprotein carrier protein
MTVVQIMEHRMRIACVLTGVLAGAVLPASAAGQDAAVTALQRAERMYERLSTLRADFVQTLENPMLGEEQATGRLFLAPPNRFAMRFTEPEGDRIVLDGEWLWLYAPSSVPDQVIRQPVPSRGAASPNLIGQFADRPLERYAAEFVRTETPGPGVTVDVVKLRPHRDDMGFRWAEVAIAQDGMFHRIVVLEESGQRRTLTFANLEADVAIPEGELRFTPQRGTRVVVP